jgi:DNA mismatch repair ATPase MutS
MFVCRLLAQWVKQPLRDRCTIAERHDMVQVILQDAEMRQALREEHLRRIPDLQALSKKLGRKKVGLQDCFRCVHSIHIRLSMHSSGAANLSLEKCRLRLTPSPGLQTVLIEDFHGFTLIFSGKRGTTFKYTAVSTFQILIH